MGGYIIEVQRNNVESVAAHTSEQGIRSDLISFKIENNGTLIDLYRLVDYLLINKHPN
jgi:hypothetical protein